MHESPLQISQDIPNVAPNPIRLDILVELIRGTSPRSNLVKVLTSIAGPKAADNPQTFHQALLLMAKLARLAPDSVLHNVMPIFTFMGYNVFHRDDSYSFRVIQKVCAHGCEVTVHS
jgi:U3 small nucleolar RNA-associated protein 10